MEGRKEGRSKGPDRKGTNMEGWVKRRRCGWEERVGAESKEQGIKGGKAGTGWGEGLMGEVGGGSHARKGRWKEAAKRRMTRRCNMG